MFRAVDTLHRVISGLSLSRAFLHIGASLHSLYDTLGQPRPVKRSQGLRDSLRLNGWLEAEVVP